jgi:DNA polymerase-3 subunit epsilon
LGHHLEPSIKDKNLDLFNQQETIIVVDFETSGMSAAKGDRVIEIGAVMLKGTTISEQFQSLVNSGYLVSREIEQLTGISNKMLIDAPPAQEVFNNFARFIESSPLVAHNASFDSKFLEMELSQIGKNRPLNFACSLQVARRIYPEAINHKLATLVNYKSLPVSARFHRALADAEMAAALWLKMQEDIKKNYGFDEVSFDLLKRLGKTAKEHSDQFLKTEAEEARKNQFGTTGSLF